MRYMKPAAALRGYKRLHRLDGKASVLAGKREHRDTPAIFIGPLTRMNLTTIMLPVCVSSMLPSTPLRSMAVNSGYFCVQRGNRNSSQVFPPRSDKRQPKTDCYSARLGYLRPQLGYHSAQLDYHSTELGYHRPKLGYSFDN